MSKKSEETVIVNSPLAGDAIIGRKEGKLVIKPGENIVDAAVWAEIKDKSAVKSLGLSAYKGRA